MACKFEYRQDVFPVLGDFPCKKFQHWLNEIGTEGWELVSQMMLTVTHPITGQQSNTWQCLFKRPADVKKNGECPRTQSGILTA